MQVISVLFAVLVVLYTVIAVADQISIQCGIYTPLFAATFVGFLLGDLQTGLIIGATLQLMTLGVATYGGATVPDYLSGAIMGTTYAIISGEGAEYGIALAIPIGLLLTQMDILGRMCNSFFQHYADRCAEKGDYRGVERANLLGFLTWAMSRVIPVMVGLIFGEAVVNSINAFIPAWFMTGLKTAGAILPAMGMAILMRYLPLKKYCAYFIIGFVMPAYAGSMFSVMAAALLVLALTADNIRDRLFGTKLEAAPGKRFCYSDPGFMFLGLMAEELDEASLDESFREHIFAPLGLADTSYHPRGEIGRFIPQEHSGERGWICGKVHDSKAYLMGESGSAGLFSTLGDMLHFVSAWLNRDERLLSRELFEKVEHTCQFGRTYGWSAEYGPGTLYHTGFTGTSILMDVREGEGFVLLTNRIHRMRSTSPTGRTACGWIRSKAPTIP